MWLVVFFVVCICIFEKVVDVGDCCVKVGVGGGVDY